MRDILAFSLAGITFLGIIIWGSFFFVGPHLEGLNLLVWTTGCMSFFGTVAFLSAMLVGFLTYLLLS